MTTDTLATARALVAHPRFEFRPGMLDQHGCRLTDRHIWDMPRDWQPPADMASNIHWRLPDLADDATAGVLVAMLHESVSCDVSLFSGFKGERRVYQIRGLAWAGAPVRNDPDGRGAQPLCEHLGVAIAKALLDVWPTPPTPG